MAKNDNGKEAAQAAVSESTAPAKSTERRFDIASLRANSVKLFGCTSSTFDGAFYGKDKEQKYTTAEADEIIKKWLKEGAGK
jgi:hypothetical protein